MDNIEAGDVFIFQLESGYGIKKVLATDIDGDDAVVHMRLFQDLFFSVEVAEQLSRIPSMLTVSVPHVALTERAFLSTQSSKISNVPLSEEEKRLVESWRNKADRRTEDRSIRLLLGLR
jgi:hypothetical protein